LVFGENSLGIGEELGALAKGAIFLNRQGQSCSKEVIGLERE
tara:strand:- start:2570 stop:2695 length:126 start_codon:yes stop_codon:yes gene_type:complete